MTGAFLRYAIVGLVQNGLFYAISLVLIFLGLAAWQAVAVFYPLAVAISFTANRSWSFADRGDQRGRFFRYAAIYAAAYPVSVFATWAQESAGVPSWAASLITMISAAVIIFIALNLWVFRTRDHSAPIQESF